LRVPGHIWIDNAAEGAVVAFGVADAQPFDLVVSSEPASLETANRPPAQSAAGGACEGRCPLSIDSGAVMIEGASDGDARSGSDASCRPRG
jgi:hypothetical protein